MYRYQASLCFCLCNLLLVSKELQMAEHLLVGNKEIRFALIRHTILQAGALNNVLDVTIVGMADAGEQMMLNLMLQATAEMIPEPRA